MRGQFFTTQNNMDMKKVNWLSANFALNILLLVGAFWGLSTDTANAVVAVGVAGVGAFGLLRQFLSSARFGGFLPTLRQGNTLTYLATVLTLLGVPAAAEIVPALSGLAEGLSAQNWGLVFSAGFAIINILIRIFKKPPTGGAVATA